MPRRSYRYACAASSCSTPLLFKDSQCCIDVARGGGSFKKLRHIRVAESYVYHCIAIEPSLSLHYVRSRDNVADIFTKACKIDTFTALRSYLMGNTSYHLTYYPLKRFPMTAGECWRVSPAS